MVIVRFDKQASLNSGIDKPRNWYWSVMGKGARYWCQAGNVMRQLRVRTYTIKEEYYTIGQELIMERGALKVQPIGNLQYSRLDLAIH